MIVVKKLISEQQLILAQDQDIPIHIVEELVVNPNDILAFHALRNNAYRLSISFLEDTLNNSERTKRYNDIARVLAVRLDLPQHLFEKLSKNDDIEVVCRIARNINCPLPILERLASDNYAIVNASLVRNNNLTKSIIESMINTGEITIDILHFIVCHPNSDDEVFQKLLDTNSIEINYTIGHRNISIDLIKSNLNRFQLSYFVNRNDYQTIKTIYEQYSDLL